MAILQEFRTKNHGKNCILQLREYYRAKNYSKMFLDSIYSVKDFYKKCGFSEEGRIFQRVGIDHIRMTLTI
jgi:predicted GNAT family N-acyltransferase